MSIQELIAELRCFDWKKNHKYLIDKKTAKAVYKNLRNDNFDFGNIPIYQVRDPILTDEQRLACFVDRLRKWGWDISMYYGVIREEAEALIKHFDEG